MMRLSVQLFCTLCALAAAVSEEPQGAPTAPQLNGVITSLYQRFQHMAAPRELELQQALNLTWVEQNVVAAVGKPLTSSVMAKFEGYDEDVSAFSCVTMMIPPEGHLGEVWAKFDAAEQLFIYQYGGSVKFHMLTTDGIHTEVILGNPVDHKDHNAKFVVMIPKGMYAFHESLSEEEATFYSYMTIPAYTPSYADFFTNEAMEAKFPAHSELFHELSS
uniref:Waterborne settlement pheromone-like protein 3 n=1 Tax=Amphibalanus improvisus TaxID=1220549 RepID=A0A4Y5QZP2_AMPIM|nr:waterborne settlement pheromone-like protein 3 [Amphibalanus improvisus]